MEQVVKEGYLFRDEPGIVRGFKKRWCTVRGNTLLFFKDKVEEGESKESIAAIHGEDITGVQPSQSAKKSKADTNVYFEVSSKHGLEYLAAADDKEAAEWIDVLKKLVTHESLNNPIHPESTEFLQIECFVQKGIRINGKIQPHILAQFSGAKKHQDEKGWFCEKYVSPSEVLNVLTENGWELGSTFASESNFPSDTKMLPVHVFIFKK